jgi:hypothetical protein
MSIPFSEVSLHLKSWETILALPCSMCERSEVVFRAEYDADEGKRPKEVLSGYAFDITDSLREKLGPVIRFFPKGKFAVCHDCAKARKPTFENMAKHEGVAQVRVVRFLASVIRPQQPATA